jgi:hypothetical protein
MLEDRVYSAFKTPVLLGRPILRVAQAQPSVGSPRRSVRLAAKPRVPNPTLPAQKVLLVKLGLVNASEPIDTAETQKLESIFVEPLSESKHETFNRVLFPNNTFLDDFVSEMDGLLP